MTTGNAPTIEFKEFRRKQIAELADWCEGFDMTGVSVSDADKQAGSPKIGDKIARNPKNHADRWLVAAAYFADNFEPVEKLAALEKPVPVEPFRRFRGVLKPVDRGMWVNGPCDYYHDAEVDTRIDSLQSALKVAQQEILDTTWQDHADHWKKRAEQAEKDREICYASLQDMRHRLHEIAALSADPRLDEKHAEQTFKEHCFWIQDSDGSWGTGCGHCFEFNHGGPDENEAKFCMYCGLPMAAQSYEEEK